jgi:hypothetical protein
MRAKTSPPSLYIARIASSSSEYQTQFSMPPSAAIVSSHSPSYRKSLAKCVITYAVFDLNFWMNCPEAAFHRSELALLQIFELNEGETGAADGL